MFIGGKRILPEGDGNFYGWLPTSAYNEKTASKISLAKKAEVSFIFNSKFLNPSPYLVLTLVFNPND